MNQNSIDRLLAACALHLAEGAVLHVKAPTKPAARRCYAGSMAVDCTIGAHTPAVGASGYAVITYGRNGDSFEYPTAEGALRCALRLLDGRAEYLRAALDAHREKAGEADPVPASSFEAIRDDGNEIRKAVWRQSEAEARRMFGGGR